MMMCRDLESESRFWPLDEIVFSGTWKEKRNSKWSMLAGKRIYCHLSPEWISESLKTVTPMPGPYLEAHPDSLITHCLL
jgi:hypothetical protein